MELKEKRTIINSQDMLVILQNVDSRKQVVVLDQTYFTIQIRRQSMIEKLYICEKFVKKLWLF